MYFARRAVRRGAKWLDKVAPGWEDEIDLETLDIANGYRCVTGQLFRREAANAGFVNGYSYFKAAYRKSSAGISRLGFLSGFFTEFSDLTDQWRIEIANRRQAKIDQINANLQAGIPQLETAS